MKEFRRSRRRQVAEIIHVTDSMTELVIGHVGNVSETGMLVMSSAPLTVDALYQLRFTLPDGVSRTAFEVGAHLLWQDKTSTPGQTWTGFRFITMLESELQQLRHWLDSSHGRAM